LSREPLLKMIRHMEKTFRTAMMSVMIAAGGDLQY